MSNMLIEKYSSLACGTEISNAAVTTPSTRSRKFLYLSKHSSS